ncbi:hypothetical protein Pth03_01070 [Planotetraspora thailandica]|uniref:Uncharacterized protein n=1 Tax=Planotetraspora thailandica TaxID=487172 RepID=A0A8J3UTE5_9ACTN|nr:hypothetical protein Pth03_01070 [Planotetraspora thailandica]
MREGVREFLCDHTQEGGFAFWGGCQGRGDYLSVRTVIGHDETFDCDSYSRDGDYVGGGCGPRDGFQ